MEIVCFDRGTGAQPPEKNRILKQTVLFWTYLRKKAQQVKRAKFAPPCPPYLRAGGASAPPCPPRRRAGGAIAPAAPVAPAPMDISIDIYQLKLKTNATHIS